MSCSSTLDQALLSSVFPSACWGLSCPQALGGLGSGRSCRIAIVVDIYYLSASSVPELLVCVWGGELSLSCGLPLLPAVLSL